MRSVPQDAGLTRDLHALGRYWWLVGASIAFAIAAVFAIGPLLENGPEARFRANVVVDALPPLFGPALLPGPFEYASLAESEDVVGTLAAERGEHPAALRPRLRAEPRPNSVEIQFFVRGDGALDIARSWERVFAAEVQTQSPALQRELAEPYASQLAQAETGLRAATAAAAADPEDAVTAQQLAAAEENFATASRLAQSYEIVADTMQAQAFTTDAPHRTGAPLGGTGARVAAAAAAGLVAGVLGALALEAANRRRYEPYGDYAPAPIAAARERTGTSSR